MTTSVEPVKRNKKKIRWDLDVEILARLALVADMRHQRAMPHEIAATLGISLSTAHRDIDRVEELWRRQSLNDVESARASSIAQYEKIERQAWKEYREATDAKTRLNALRVAMDAEEKITELQGTKQPKGIDLTSKGERVAFNARDLTDEELALIVTGR